MAKLARSVVVRDPATNRYVSLARGADLPDWAAEQVTNPRLLEPAAVEETTVAPPAPPPPPPPAPAAELPADFDPDATIGVILDKVEVAPSQAALYLEAELAKGDEARTTLVDRLATIVANPPRSEQ